jgi:hypothetical protein
MIDIHAKNQNKRVTQWHNWHIQKNPIHNDVKYTIKQRMSTSKIQYFKKNP